MLYPAASNVEETIFSNFDFIQTKAKMTVIPNRKEQSISCYQYIGIKGTYRLSTSDHSYYLFLLSISVDLIMYIYFTHYSVSQ